MLRHLQKILHGFDFVYIVCVLLLMFYCVLIRITGSCKSNYHTNYNHYQNAPIFF
jgi:hypothetical protein